MKVTILAVFLSVLLVGCSKSEYTVSDYNINKRVSGTVVEISGTYMNPNILRCGDSPTYVLKVRPDDGQGQYVVEVRDRYGNSPKSIPNLAAAIKIGTHLHFPVCYGNDDSECQFTTGGVGQLTPANVILDN